VEGQLETSLKTVHLITFSAIWLCRTTFAARQRNEGVLRAQRLSTTYKCAHRDGRRQKHLLCLGWPTASTTTGSAAPPNTASDATCTPFGGALRVSSICRQFCACVCPTWVRNLGMVPMEHATKEEVPQSSSTRAATPSAS
jgi:hypothetical protein